MSTRLTHARRPVPWLATVANWALSVRFSGVIVILGAVALCAGPGELTGVDVSGLSLLLILCGLALIAAQLIRRGEAWNGQA